MKIQVVVGIPFRCPQKAFLNHSQSSKIAKNPKIKEGQANNKMREKMK